VKQKSIFIILMSFSVIIDSCADKITDSDEVESNRNRTKEIFSIVKQVKENTIVPDSVIIALNAQHHHMKVLARRTIPGPFIKPEMKFYTDYIARVDSLPVINPGPGEYVHVMEGQRNGYNNLTIGITETFPNGAPPMHSHEGEESHVLLEGEILYALGDTLFTLKAPYVVNIPAGMPHAFKNIGKQTANLVVIFPTNIWKYDVLDFFPFKSDTAKKVSRFSKFKNSLAGK